jgi:hypothetical protein
MACQGEFHDKLGGNRKRIHIPLCEIGRFCKVICMHSCITCKIKCNIEATDARIYLKFCGL